jgi:hypothetical protein
MGRKEVRLGQLAAPERMPTVPVAIRLKVTGGVIPIQLTNFPVKSGDVVEVNQLRKENNTMKKKGLYDNINARKKSGTSRPKSKSTIDPKVYKKMKSKKGGFKEK